MKDYKERYFNSHYLKNNPTWHKEDAHWKASFVVKMLEENNIQPQSICEIGCGSGEVLSALGEIYKQAELTGFDISPDAAQFWNSHKDKSIQFINDDFLSLNNKTYDVILLLDVLEHMTDPFTFLLSLHNKARYYLIHFPLDLSVLSIVRENKLLDVRKSLGHIHYFTKNLALQIVKESNFHVVSHSYSGAMFSSPQKTWKTLLASIPRFIAYILNKDLGVRLLGGETLFVLCEDKFT